MSVVLRMQRRGNTHRPFYQFVATDRKAPRDGRFIEKVGYYDPAHEPSTFVWNKERVQHWYSKGASLSPTVEKLLRRNDFKFERNPK
jgi:small subunit ribosomal protein S16